MYRLLTFKCAPLQNVKIVLSSAQRQCQAGLLTRRMQSTSIPTHAELLDKRKKRRLKPRYAKYVDILEVTEVAANEKKSRVKRLKAKKLQDFISKTKQQILEKRAKAEARSCATKTKFQVLQPAEYQRINMEALDNAIILDTDFYDDRPLIFFGKEEYTKKILTNPVEIENILKSFKNFREIIETMGNENQSVDETNLTAYSLNEPDVHPMESSDAYILNDFSESIEQKPNLEVSFKSIIGKSKSRFKSKHDNNPDVERLAKQRALRINLTTYLNVCIAAGLLTRALSTLLNYRQRAQKHNPKSYESLITIEMYNTLLHGFAGKGNFDRIKDTLELINEDKLSFNEQTYAAILECFGRQDPTFDNLRMIREYIAKIKDTGFTLNQIMDHSKFLFDQREIILDAIRRVSPDFQPSYTPPVLNYENTLLNHLNKKSNIKPKESNDIQSRLGFSRKEMEQMARDQLKIELDGHITIASIEKANENANPEFWREKLKQLESVWQAQIAIAITRDLNSLRAQMRFKPSGYMNNYTYLKTLDTQQYCDILIKEIYKLGEGSETFSPTVGQLHKELGQKVQQRHQIEQKKNNGILEKTGTIYSAYAKELENGKKNCNTRQIWQSLVHEHRQNGPCMDIKEETWPAGVLAGVGRFLYNILMRDIKIDANMMRQKTKMRPNLLPAFYTLFRNHGRLVKEEVKPHPVLARLLRASKQRTLTFDSNLVPMLCPPQPWSTPYNGGYLLNKSDLIRLPHQAIQQWERINAANTQNLYPALDSLNQLASIPWRVNTDILDVIIDVFQNGGDNSLDVPQPPSSLPQLPNMPKNGNMSNAERVKIFRQKLGHRRKQAEMYSLWCDTLYRLSLANHYRDKVFWLPHNMDFRGRVYPVPPHLNHLGSDLARSMLKFNVAKPLGPDGFNWLKLHCINLTGLKKRDSVKERLLYAEDVMEEILDSADNPLRGRKWWTTSDEPWQTLACCMEIAKVHRSANPAEYMSHFPIHQDGSCNGLQHYAALGRDQAGAISVNLAPSKVPQDVYSAVAELVEKSRKQDVENGLHVAEALDGFVRRKVIKQTVMTTVYGVTRYGARLQIARQLKDIDDFPKDWVWPASTYLTTKTFESLREMFSSTREIQDWFTECARLISGVCGENVEWCTPLGLPVVQPYNRPDTNYVRNSNRMSEQMMPMDLYERPNVMKQKNAFPPNFIHSLDSSHMMLTSLHCEREGLTFVSVHDCFWTHACNVGDMNRICREQFVSLHSQPILEDLSKFLVEKFSFSDSECVGDTNESLTRRHLNRVLRTLPQKGDFDLANVLKSVYFFS